MSHLRARNLVGQRHFRLVVIERLPNHSHSTEWKARCDCGTEITILGCNWGKKIKSCGCLQKETKNDPKPHQALPDGEAARRQVINTYIGNARSRNLKFDLPDDLITLLFKGDCFYCGASPSFVRKGRFGYGDFIYNGIDRIDSSGDYKPNNVVSCCFTCNRAKGEMSIKEFKNWINQVSNLLAHQKETVSDVVKTWLKDHPAAA
jgi:hypothetical protein